MISYNLFPYIVGVDEVGRGPVAGPVTVGAVVVPRLIPLSFFRGLKDSKQLSSSMREWWFAHVCERKMERNIRYAISSVGPKIIDERGIVFATSLAIKRALGRLSLEPKKCLVLLDGSLHAPDIYINQHTIIRGDERIPVIKLASVMAKVRRDRYMTYLSEQYPGYGFEVHKGYGTHAHYHCLNQFGLCKIHRKTFLHR